MDFCARVEICLDNVEKLLKNNTLKNIFLTQIKSENLLAKLLHKKNFCRIVIAKIL